jgi:hypothetical protein
VAHKWVVVLKPLRKPAWKNQIHSCCLRNRYPIRLRSKALLRQPH